MATLSFQWLKSKLKHHSWLFSLVWHWISQQVHDPTSTVYPESTCHLPTATALVSATITSHLDCYRKLTSCLCVPVTYCWHNQPSQQIVALNNNHFIMLVDSAGQEFRKDIPGQLFLCPKISGASAGMTLLARSGTAGPEGSVSKMASSLLCLHQGWNGWKKRQVGITNVASLAGGL